MSACDPAPLGTGYARVEAPTAGVHQIEIEVIADGDQVMWRTAGSPPPGHHPMTAFGICGSYGDETGSACTGAADSIKAANPTVAAALLVLGPFLPAETTPRNTPTYFTR